MAMDVKSSGQQQHSRPCPHCGATVGASANFCGSCSATLTKQMAISPRRRTLLLVVLVGLLSVVVVAAAGYLLVSHRGSSSSSGPGFFSRDAASSLPPEIRRAVFERSPFAQIVQLTVPC